MTAARQCQCRADPRHPFKRMACVVVAANLLLICPALEGLQGIFRAKQTQIDVCCIAASPHWPDKSPGSLPPFPRWSLVPPSTVWHLVISCMLSARVFMYTQAAMVRVQWNSGGEPNAASADGTTARRNPVIVSLEAPSARVSDPSHLMRERESPGDALEVLWRHRPSPAAAGCIMHSRQACPGAQSGCRSVYRLIGISKRSAAVQSERAEARLHTRRTMR